MFSTSLTFFFLFPFWLSVCERERQGHTNGLRHTHTQRTQKSRHLTKAICWARGSHPAEVWHCVTEHCGSGKKVNTARSALHLVWKAYSQPALFNYWPNFLRHVHGSAAFDAWCDWKLLIGSSFHLSDICFQQFTWKKGERNYFDADWKRAQRLNWSVSQHFSGSHAVFVYTCHISEVFNLINFTPSAGVYLALLYETVGQAPLLYSSFRSLFTVLYDFITKFTLFTS